ncbi:MAG: GlsB/YeaQ/YmgE family stress response membrane protein [Pseudomonadota bacterium]
MNILLWIFIGGVAGWLAEQVMKSNHGILMNIALGVIGAIVLNTLLALLGLGLGGIIGQLIVAFLGACMLIAGGRALRHTA